MRSMASRMLWGSGIARNFSSQGESADIEKHAKSRQTGKARMNRVYRADYSPCVIIVFLRFLFAGEWRRSLPRLDGGPPFFCGSSDCAASSRTERPLRSGGSGCRRRRYGSGCYCCTGLRRASAASHRTLQSFNRSGQTIAFGNQQSNYLFGLHRLNRNISFLICSIRFDWLILPPPRFCQLLFNGPHLIECLALPHISAFHNIANCVGITDIVKWIFVQDK